MTTKHTPGPWRKAATGAIVDKHGDSICLMTKIYPSPIADARLIVASPIMYAYIEARAKDGDAQAQSILDGIHA